MNSAIVTGATGFVGIHLTQELLARGAKVAALCRENSPNLGRLPPGVEVFYSMEDLPGAEAFYHLAWESASGPGRADPLLQARGADLTMRALLAAKRLDCRKFVALGTIYERFAQGVRESEKAGSADFYMLSKEYAHAMTKQLALKLGIEYAWCTICHPIGRYIKSEQLMAYVVTSLLRGDTPSLGPATALFDVVGVWDVARGLCLVGEKAGGKREYYIGTGEPRPLREYFEQARRILGVDTPLGIGQRPDDGLRFERSWFDISALERDTGYRPQVSFEDAVLDLADALRPKV